MTVKYVKNFSFPKEFGFTGSAGSSHVSSHMRKGGMHHSSHHQHPHHHENVSEHHKSGGHVHAGGKHHYAKGGHVEDKDCDGMAKGGHWIAGAIKHPGALHKQLGVPQGKKIPAKKLAKAAKSEGKLGERARLAEKLKGFHHAKGGMHKGSDGAELSDIGARKDKAPHEMGKSAASSTKEIAPSNRKRFKIGGRVEANFPTADQRGSGVSAGGKQHYAKGGDVDEGPVRKTEKRAHEGEFADFKRGGKAKHGGKVVHEHSGHVIHHHAIGGLASEYGEGGEDNHPSVSSLGSAEHYRRGGRS